MTRHQLRLAAVVAGLACATAEFRCGSRNGVVPAALRGTGTVRGSTAFGQGSYTITGNGVYLPRVETQGGVVEAGARGGWTAMCVTQIRADGGGGFFLRSSKNSTLYACAWAKPSADGSSMQLRYGRGEGCYDTATQAQTVPGWVAAEDPAPPVCVQVGTVPASIRGTDGVGKPSGAYAVLQASSLNLVRDRALNGDIWCAEGSTQGRAPEDVRVQFTTGCVWYRALRDRLMFTSLDRSCRAANWTATGAGRVGVYPRFSYVTAPSASPRPTRPAGGSRSRTRKAKK